MAAVPDPLVAAVLEPPPLKVVTRVPAVLELKTRTAGTVTLMPAVILRITAGIKVHSAGG